MAGPEGAFSRAWTDFKSATTHWWFRALAALLTAGFATWSALLPSDAGKGERAALAIGGTLGGALLLGLLAFGVLVGLAPIRQRNDARTKLAELSAPFDPASLAREFSDWLRTKQAALPDYPSYPGPLFLFEREAREKRDAGWAAAELRYRQSHDDVERQARVEYHERFRKGVLDLLPEDQAQASEPRTLEDLKALRALIAHRVGSDSSALGMDSPLEMLRDALREGMDLLAVMNQSESDRWLGPVRSDPVCLWAKSTWKLIREHFSEHADAFWGPELTGMESGYFGAAYDLESEAPGTDGRRGYLERRIELLKQITGKVS